MTQYTPNQTQAINQVTRNLQIIACAGSGKTQVISQRVAEILKRDGVRPGNVVAFTFTDKAGLELTERIHSIIEEEGLPRIGMAEMFIGTMHGFALNTLQTHVPDLFKYSVLDEIGQRLLVDRYSRESGLTETEVRANQRFLKRFQNTRLYVQALTVLREDQVDFSLISNSLKNGLSKYRALLDRHRLLDYSSILEKLVDLLETDPTESGSADALQLHDYVRDQIKFLIVDEYQDLNPLQERLVQGLVQYGANLCVVGDDDQTIYQWRGSEVRQIVEFENRFEQVDHVVLDSNFRSSEGIVALARAIINEIPANERLDKQMISASHIEWVRGDMLALEYDSSLEEAEGIAAQIKALLGTPFSDSPTSPPRGLSWSDNAILFRSLKDADALIDVFRREQIPYAVRGMGRLFDAPEIQCFVGLFGYLVGATDSADLRQQFEQAGLLPQASRFSALLTRLDSAMDVDGSQRWGVYNIQRLYLETLELLGIREDTIPSTQGRGDLVMHQLGQFSQVISDFEAIHFSSEPLNKYKSFYDFLQFQAPNYYADATGEATFASPDAVSISTVHGAKGMQWASVFLPSMRRNRFPSSGQGGLGLFHLMPENAVRNHQRYKGTREDELRLFYVAVTRAKKYLSISWAPLGGVRNKKASEFYTLATKNAWVSTTSADRSVAPTRAPEPRFEQPRISISFSELKYLFECPYQFKLRFVYGFNPPIHEALGYGKGLHDALAEMHKRGMDGSPPAKEEAEQLVKRHLHIPYAYPALRQELERSAIDAIERYFDQHGSDLQRTILAEKAIEIMVGPGVKVTGRIDLIKHIETGETSIVDFKSTERAQAEDVTRDQLHVYALGFTDLTGDKADLVEVLNLDAAGRNTREKIDETLLENTRSKIMLAANDLREGRFVCGHATGSHDGDDLRWLFPQESC